MFYPCFCPDRSFFLFKHWTRYNLQEFVTAERHQKQEPLSISRRRTTQISEAIRRAAGPAGSLRYCYFLPRTLLKLKQKNVEKGWDNSQSSVYLHRNKSHATPVVPKHPIILPERFHAWGKLRWGRMYQVGEEAAASKHGQTDLFCPHLTHVYCIFIAPRAAGSQGVLTALQCVLEGIQEPFDSLTHARLVSSKPAVGWVTKKTTLLHLLDNTQEDFVRFLRDLSLFCLFVSDPLLIKYIDLAFVFCSWSPLTIIS